MKRETKDYMVFTATPGQKVDLIVDIGKSPSKIARNIANVVYRQNCLFAGQDNTGVYHPMGHIIRDGKLQRYYLDLPWSWFVIPTVGIPYVSETMPDPTGVRLAFQTTCRLMKDGKIDIRDKEEHTAPDIAGRSATRSAIGVNRKTGEIHLVTTKRAYSLLELAKLMLSLGCEDAQNLDGGGSTETDQDDYPVEYERPTSSAIIVIDEGVKPSMQPILIIDPGHGGKDPGGGTNQFWKEKDMTLQISLYQKKRFDELGVPVALTRTTDVYLSPEERTKIVRDSGATFCISNHLNAGGGAGADGAELIHSIYSDGRLEGVLADRIKAAGQNIRRIFTRKLDNSNKDYYFMHRDTGAVATTIVEYGFADSTADDVAQIRDHWQELAEAVVKGFCQFNGFKYSPPVTNVPQAPEGDFPKVTGTADVIFNGQPIGQGYFIGDSVYFPVRKLTEAFGGLIDWDGQNVKIKK